jgi:hypothetical protein
MKNYTLKILSVLFLLSAAQFAQANPVINEVDGPEFLYTMSTKSGTYADGILTLNDVPVVVYFADRPARMSGQLSLQVFAQGWDTGAQTLEKDPPNGTLSIFAEDKDNNVVLELSDPNVMVKEGKISFKVRVLFGELPENFGHATLFIDAVPNLGLSGQITD